MPTKHIDNETWASIEALTIKAINLSGKLVKETDMIRLLVKKGAETVTDDEIRNINGFTPQYQVLSCQRDGECFQLTSHGTVNPDEYASFLHATAPNLTYVYGATCTGKTNFKDRLLSILPEKTCDSLKVIDADDWEISDELRKTLIEDSFKKNKPVILIEHGTSTPEIMTRMFRAMAGSDVNFVFAGKTASGKVIKPQDATNL